MIYVNSQKKVEPLPKVEREEKKEDVPRLSVVAENLEIPWALAFLPDGQIIFTERPGRVELIDKEGNVSAVASISQVKHIGEGGLLGVAVHPDFNENKFIYLYYTYSSTGENTLNRVARYRFENNILAEERVIIDAIPGAANHNGGRMKFGPDKFLYITTGDAQNPSLAQNKNSLAGKILRVTNEGLAASGNPFSNRIYSYGHRNPQGLVWDEKGQFWATEHGPLAHDELNLIEIGKNYGWPNITGSEKAAGMESPLLESGSSTWAPAGMTFVSKRNSLFFGGLRGNALFEAVVKDNRVELKEHLKSELGRIRDVVLGPDRFLYVTTSNRDGRGIPKAGDDKIIRVNPEKL